MQKAPLILSNLTAIYPVSIAITNGDFRTGAYILIAGTSSSIRHIITDQDDKKLKWTKYINDIGILIIGLRVMAEFDSRNYHPKSKLMHSSNKLLFLLSCFILKFISEQNKKRKSRYIILHSFWHIFAFFNLGVFLKDYVY